MLQHDITDNKYYFYGSEISAEMYAEIRAILDDMPTAPQGYFYILTENLEWELREAPPDEPDAEEILSILTGGAS